jgi:hypothetical protein
MNHPTNYASTDFIESKISLNLFIKNFKETFEEVSKSPLKYIRSEFPVENLIAKFLVEHDAYANKITKDSLSFTHYYDQARMLDLVKAHIQVEAEVKTLHFSFNVEG